MNKNDYYDWLILLNNAKESGLTDSDIKNFLLEQSNINVKKKIIKKSRHTAFKKWYLYKK